MRKKIVAGNWKMHGDGAFVQELLSSLAGAQWSEAIQAIVFPPYPYLSQAQSLLKDSRVAWGAQDVSSHDLGAFTGEVAASQLADFGCGYVLIGHSERRQYHSEDNTLLAQKLSRCYEAGLRPVFCVGETQQERERDETDRVILSQLEALLACESDANLKQTIIAYEPVWAIGTGLTATPEQAQAVHAFIRAQVAVKDEALAQTMPVLYGGSVKPGNAQDLFSQPDIDGGLVGGASLKAKDFIEILSCNY